MNYGTESRNKYLKGIDDNKYIPKEYKAELKQIISNQFLVMAHTVGYFELLCHRERAFYNSTTELKTNG